MPQKSDEHWPPPVQWSSGVPCHADIPIECSPRGRPRGVGGGSAWYDKDCGGPGDSENCRPKIARPNRENPVDPPKGPRDNKSRPSALPPRVPSGEIQRSTRDVSG